MIRRPPRSTLFPYTRSSDLSTPEQRVARRERNQSILDSINGKIAGLRTEISARSEEHTFELQSQSNLVCRLLLEKKKKTKHPNKQQPKYLKTDIHLRLLLNQ